MANEHVDDEEEERLTPYQGQRRSFGLFRCGQCDRHWASANSWANCGQECKMCQTMTYPYLQRPLLRRRGKKVKDKQHPQELCEKCVEVEDFCGSRTERPKNRRRRRRGNQN